MTSGKIVISSLEKEGLMQVAKWNKFPVLLDSVEMQELFTYLSPFHLVNVSSPVKIGMEEISSQEFLQGYGEYVGSLKQGEIPLLETYRSLLSCALSRTFDPFYAIKVGADRLLVKPRMPVIQLQAHSFFYSEVDKQFHSMVQGKQSVLWGVQFSYPQLFQDPKAKTIVKVREEFENTSLFSSLSQWIRSNTLATPFVVEGVRTNSPMRIGKKGIEWVNNHPQLKAKSITVLIKSS